MIAATVVSAGRGDCCDGLDPAFRIPRGIAAWDVIRFTIPEGVTGCAVPVLVQIGRSVSNPVLISVDPGGSACVPPLSTLPPEILQSLSSERTGGTISNLSLVRGIGISPDTTRPGSIRVQRRDTGGAGFTRVTNYSPPSVHPPQRGV